MPTKKKCFVCDEKYVDLPWERCEDCNKMEQANIRPYKYYSFGGGIMLDEDKQKLNKANKDYISFKVLIKSPDSIELIEQKMPELLPNEFILNKIHELYDKFIEGGATTGIIEEYTYNDISWEFGMFMDLLTGNINVGIFGKVTKKEE